MSTQKENEKRIREYVENSWLNLGKDYPMNKRIDNPFLHRTKEEIENPLKDILGIFYDPKNLYFTVKHLFGIELLPFQLAILDELWHRKYPMLIATRGGGKSFILGLYAMLRAFLHQGAKVVIVGSGFRQSKVVFDYCERIWTNAPVLRSICNQAAKAGPSHAADMYTMTLGESYINALPIGSGDKIRGQRANYILSDEFASQNEEIYENVISGFAAVSANPVEQVKDRAYKKAMAEMGLVNDSYDSSFEMGNQAVISGTAYYDFNLFAKYWKRYKAIIKSKGDPHRLKEVFPEGVPDSFDWKDYSIVRIPVEALPPGFMDEKHVSRSRATIHSGLFQMEYGACHGPDTKIITDTGVKSIVDVNINDLVLTHKGRFRKVLKKTFLQAPDIVMNWSTYGGYEDNITTANHPFWNGKDWEPLGGLTNKTSLSSLKELNENKELDFTKDIISDYMEFENLIYPIHSQTRFNRNELRDIRNEYTLGIPIKDIAKKYDTIYGTIANIVKQQRRPKNAIPRKIALDYNFGMIVGYYASEGYCGASDRNIGFALDGHVNVKLESFISQLSKCFEDSFGLTPKIYNKKDNVCAITVNQVFMSKIFKHICPGVSHTKLIKHDILFSNREFLKGFITGYWNGDGHWREDTNVAIATCVNLSLLTQIKVALSYFGINSSLKTRKGKGNSTFRGKTYNTKQAYSLVLSGDNGRKFKEEFYGIKSEGTTRTKHLWFDEDNMFFEITKKEQIDYNGLVYNLEVEEDHSYSLMNATVHNCFATDSNGFFKRSLIESCVTTTPINIDGQDIQFHADIKGNKSLKYIYGIDPASQIDNFSIVIIELHETHRRIIYSWTTNKSKHKEEMKSGLVKEQDYYGYCARKIRDLMKVFPCERIALDSQGGGFAIEEALHDPDKYNHDEKPIWRIIEEDKPQDTDDYPGLHIIELINFAKADWVSNANHGLRKDFEDKVLLFPYHDPLSIGFAIEEDKRLKRVGGSNTLENCVDEIEELKDELATIVHTQTSTSGRDRWDTPEIKVAGGKKGRMRKDRYSALLMANMVARTLDRTPEPLVFNHIGGYVGDAKAFTGGAMYQGPEWFTQPTFNGGFCGVVRRGV